MTQPSHTAFITGASSGIGAIYAERLAARGYNLILAARREDRLQALADQLQARYAIQASILKADLSAPRNWRVFSPVRHASTRRFIRSTPPRCCV